MRSKPSKMRGRSGSGMPMMSPMTVIGSASATSSIQSPLPRASRSSIIRAARARMPSSSLAIARGVKALEMSFRCLLCSGGSSVMIVGYDANRSAGWMSGPSPAVNESASRCSRTACRCLVVIQKSRLTVFCDTRRQPVPEQRSGAAKLGEQLVGKAIAPQCEIRQIDCRSRHWQPRLIRTLTPRGGRVC